MTFKAPPTHEVPLFRYSVRPSSSGILLHFRARGILFFPASAFLPDEPRWLFNRAASPGGSKLRCFHVGLFGFMVFRPNKEEPV